MSVSWLPAWHIIGGLCALGVLSASLGCFVVWRRMAYFGDALSHSALIGIGAGLALGVAPTLGVFVIALIFVLLFVQLRNSTQFSSDTLLGILAHGSLGLGLVGLGLNMESAEELHHILLGNVLEMQLIQSGLLGAAAVLVAGLLSWRWQKLLLLTLNEELARGEGVAVLAHEHLLMILLGLSVALTIQVMGVLLITSLLIIPISTARLIAHTPLAMCLWGVGLSIIAQLVGVALALTYGLDPAPVIVSVACALFLVALVLRRK